MPNLTSMLSSDTLTSISRYDLAIGATTATLDLSTQQVFTVDATTTARTLSFSNVPGAGRTMVAVIEINGNNTITWPSDITWSGGVAPELNVNWTEITLKWNPTVLKWRGFKSGGANNA